MDHDYPTERRAFFEPRSNPGGTVLIHKQPDDIWRVDYQLAVHQDANEVLQPEQMRRFVQTHLDAIGEGHLPWKPVWTSIYRAGAMTLDAYRHGHILFAGNSAHAMPIFGVRGLNSGFDDADNLIWKLAAVLRGKGDEALLDSYSSERVQAFHVNAASAMRSTEFMSPPHRGFELMREAVLSLAGRHPDIARLISPRQTHAITYAQSPLSSGQDDVGIEGPSAGAPLVDARVAGGRHLTDLLARDGFTLLAFAARPLNEAVEAATHAAPWGFLPCRSAVVQAGGDASGWLAQTAAQHADTVYLVRPDGHVCGRWRAPAVDTVLAAIRRACGAERTSS
jgi:3-(3-hydroxy-phenyl)propionate hydroxylase